MRTKILLINNDPARSAAVRRALIESIDGVFQVESTAIDTIDRLLHALPQLPILVLSAPQDQGMAKLAVKHQAQESSVEDVA